MPRLWKEKDPRNWVKWLLQSLGWVGCWPFPSFWTYTLKGRFKKNILQGTNISINGKGNSSSQLPWMGYVIFWECILIVLRQLSKYNDYLAFFYPRSFSSTCISPPETRQQCIVLPISGPLRHAAKITRHQQLPERWRTLPWPPINSWDEQLFPPRPCSLQHEMQHSARFNTCMFLQLFHNPANIEWSLHDLGRRIFLFHKSLWRSYTRRSPSNFLQIICQIWPTVVNSRHSLDDTNTCS